MSNRRRNLSWLMILLCLLLGVSCTTLVEEASQSDEEVINPGDTVGDFLVRTGEPGEYIYLWECGGNEQNFCKVDSDAIVNISVGLFAEPGEDLDQIWAEHTYEMTIDGRPVNLPAFGSVDAVHPDVGAMRAWNIVLVPSKPSAVETFHSVMADGDIFELEIPYIFGESARGKALEEAALNSMQADDALPILLPTAKAGQQAYYSEEAELDYLLFVPGDYVANSEQEWPLIIYLHGAIPRSNIEMLRESGLPKVLEDKDDLPFFIVSPRVLGGYEFWGEEKNIDALTALLAEIEMKLPIDSRRIYLTGASGGGYGTWEIGLRYPDRFAALAPVAGYYGWPFSVPENICDLKDVPVWAFHGAKDERLSLEVEQQIVDALEECGGNVQFTVFPEGGHDIDEEVYTDQDLYEWLLSQ
jgi:poly(3-hydroxybutyrate) depolymerase